MRSVTAGEDWATAQLGVPAPVDAELSEYSFHPALIDGAFQTLFGAPFLGQQGSDEPFLPTRIRHYAVYGRPTEQMTVHVRVGTATREQVDSDITITDSDGTPLVVINGFSVQSLSTSSRMSAERIDKGLYTIDWEEAAQPDGLAAPDATREGATASTWLVLTDDSGVGAAVAERLSHLGHRVTTLGYERADGLGAALSAHLSSDPSSSEASSSEAMQTGIVDCWPLDITSDGDHRRGVFRCCGWSRPLRTTPRAPQSFSSSPPTRNQPRGPSSPESTRHRCGGWAVSSVIRSSPSAGVASSTSTGPMTPSAPPSASAHT